MAEKFRALFTAKIDLEKVSALTNCIYDILCNGKIHENPEKLDDALVLQELLQDVIGSLQKSLDDVERALIS